MEISSKEDSKNSVSWANGAHWYPAGLRTSDLRLHEVAKMLGISVDLLRLRIKMGKYPTPLRSNGNQRLFTSEDVQKLRAIH